MIKPSSMSIQAKQKSMTEEITQVIQRFEATIALVENEVKTSLPQIWDKSPAPGKWTIRQIMAHLADCEAIAAMRFRLIAAQPGSTLTAFDQDIWAQKLTYSKQPVETALAAYVTMRRYNVHMLRNLPEDAWSRIAMHEERGPQTLTKMVEHNSKHAEDHAAQIRRIREQFA